MRELKKAILDADEKVLVMQFQDFIPTKEEIEDPKPFNSNRIK